MGVMIVGGGVGLVPVLMDLVQTPDETREKIMAATIRSTLGLTVY